MQAFKRYGSVVAFGAVCALGACGKSDNAADSAAAPATAMTPDAGTGMTGTPADSANAANAAGAPAGGAMSAANIASMIGLTNGTEIQAAKVAQDKATNADVKSFAKQMIADHQAMQKSLDSLTTAINVTPQPPATADQKKQAGDQMIATLNSTPKGAAFDKAYIDGQVQAHQQAVNELQSFSSSASDPQLKSVIDAAIPKVQAHLDKAQQLQSKLGGSGS